MTLPTSYTEATFGTYLEAVLGTEVKAVLGISAITTGDEIIYDTLIDYGITDIAYDTKGNEIYSLQSRNGWNDIPLTDSIAIIIAKQEYKASLDR